MGSGVLLRNSDDQVLLVEPTYKAHWELPGGAVETAESPYAAAVREVREELGLSVTLGRLLVVDWVPPRPDRTDGVMFIYDGGLLAPAAATEIHLPAEELRSWAWSTPTQAEERLSPPLARRLAAALAAAVDGVTGYLEDGHRVV